MSAIIRKEKLIPPEENEIALLKKYYYTHISKISVASFSAQR